MADEIFVINVDGYIVESTSNEIAYAKSQGICVRYLEPLKVAQKVIAIQPFVLFFII